MSQGPEPVHSVERDTRYETLFRHLPMGLYVADADGRILESNSHLAVMLGRPDAESLRGEPLTGLFVEDADRRRWVEQLEVDGEIRMMAARARREDGSSIWLIGHAILVRDDEGRPYRQHGCFCDATRRIADEEELRRSKERFRQLAENVPDWIWEVDATGKYTYCSPGLTRLLGYEVEEVLGKTPFELMNPPEAERVRALFKAAVAECEPITGLQNVNVHKDGHTVVLETSGAPFFDAEGRLAGYRGIDRDITERREMEDALRESERTLQTILQAAPAGIGLVRDGVLVWTNEQIRKMLGYSAEELEGTGARVLYESQEEFERVGREGHAQIPGTATRSVETRWVSKDGRSTDILLSSSALDPSDPGKDRIFTATDISALMAAERALQESERRYRQLVDTMQEGLSVAGPDYVLTYVNKRFAEMVGYSPDEMVGHHLLEFVSEGAKEAMRRQIRHRKKGAAGRYELTWKAKDGRMVYTINSPMGLFNPDGSFAGSFGVITDITALKQDEEERIRLREQLRQAQKMEAIGRLAGGVAHDFNNQLTVIRGYCDMMLAALTPGDPCEAPVKEIIKAAVRSSQLTGQLLAFGRRQVLQPEVIDPWRVVSDLQASLARMLGEDIRVSATTAGGVGRIEVDRSQFEQALINMAINSRDAMPNGGELSIDLAGVRLAEGDARLEPDVTAGDFVMITVTDSGKGMDEATRRQVFDPFFTTKEPGKGAGLGLSMVYGFVKQSGGEISVESGPDRGATFRMYLPKVWTEEQAVGAAALEPGEPMTGSETVLVVEDEDTVRRYVTQMLRHRGYTVLEAPCPDVAIAMEREYTERIDLLVTDVVMPDMRGPEVAKIIKRDRPSIRILYVSGYAEDSLFRPGALSPGEAFLPKPFNSEQLAGVVRRILEQPGIADDED